MVEVTRTGPNEAQTDACLVRGVPPPAGDSERFVSSNGDIVFDWRYSGKVTECGQDTPSSLRWRFRRDDLIAFIGYGWRTPDDQRRLKAVPSYGILPHDSRDAVAREMLLQAEPG